MLTPFCISFLQVSNFKLSQIYCWGVDAKLWSINRRLMLYNVHNTPKRLFYWGTHAWQTSFLSLWTFCWLSLTASQKEAPLPQKPGYLEESPAAHCAWVPFKLLGGSFSVKEIHKPSPFDKAKQLIISQGCTHPPRPSTAVGEEKRRPFSTIPSVSQDWQNEIHLYQLFHFMFLTGQSKS